MKKTVSRCCVWAVLCLILLGTSVIVSAETLTDENKYYLGTAVNTGKDNGYSESNAIDEKDPHFGWNLGKFYVSGYTRAMERENPIFLKNVGDTVSLWFSLEQDIMCLNGEEALTIYEDNNGYDQYFGIEKTNFGRGTLVIRHIDYQNNVGEPKIYTNYLDATVSGEADTKVDIFEEGDYEVALNYEIKNDPRKIFGVSIVPTYTNYRIFFRFSVRNGNCMVFPFDTVTGAELTNTSITENGFYLNLAKSRYLDIDIKREILTDGAQGLVEDVRFNRPARDGEVYGEEGIYTITVRNRYTEQETVKKIYVGTDPILKAHVTTGYSIAQIRECVEEGATIAEDGTLVRTEVNAPSKDEGDTVADEKDGSDSFGAKVKGLLAIVFKICLGICGILVLWVVFRMIFPKSRRR